jgi:hypothetical protein
LLQLSLKFTEIVNLPVKDDLHLAIGGRHRLGSSFRQIEDREPTMGKTDPRIRGNPDPFPIRPPGCHPIPASLQPTTIHRWRIRRSRKNCRYAAHTFVSWVAVFSVGTRSAASAR